MQKYFNKLSPNNKGFTIIELIVVVAIIAVLASIVLVNVTGYVNQSKDAAVKANLSSLMIDAANRYINDGNYTSACMYTWTAVNNALNATTNGGARNCYSDSVNNYNAWCAYSNLKSGGTFCVDSNGKKSVNGSSSCNGTSGGYYCS